MSGYREGATMTISEPGFYWDIPEADYHADPCPSPSLSASIANVLIDQSPGHAWYAHPRLNIRRENEPPTKAQNLGVALHKLILGKGAPLKIINADDYRTNAAKDARDKAIANGETPLLNKEMEAAEEIAKTALRRLARTPVASLLGADNGDAEVTLAWREHNGIWCRSRVDWLPKVARQGGHITVLDLKTTAQSAKAEDWQKIMFDMGGDVQSEFYKRGLRTLIPGVRSVRFVFVVIEQVPPYAVEVCETSGEAAEDAKDSLALAIRTWGECLARGVNEDAWPMYGDQIMQIDPPAWRKYATEMKRMRLANRIAQWQRPLGHDDIKTLEGATNA